MEWVLKICVNFLYLFLNMVDVFFVFEKPRERPGFFV
jgi:hypothetical protein